MICDATKMTLREVYDKFYDKGDLRPATLEKHKADLRRWEKFTDNPSVGEVTNATMMACRDDMKDSGLAPETINGSLRSFKAFFRCIGPQTEGCPYGLGLIDRIPVTKPLKHRRKTPKRLALNDLTKLYQACKHARGPRKFVPPVDWWRAFVVVAYCTGFRKSDLLALTHDMIDLDAGVIDFQAVKTGKIDLFPLHPVAVNHLKRIWKPEREYIFQGYSKQGGRFYKTWGSLCKKAGVDFTPHDIRKTSASEIEAAAPGLSDVFLQHAPNGVTQQSYLNRSVELRDAIHNLNIPTGFCAGIGMQETAERKAIETKVKVRPVDYLAPIRPEPDLWTFEPGRWRFGNSDWFRMKGQGLNILRAIAVSEKPITVDQLASIIWQDRQRPPYWRDNTPGRVSEVRSRVAACLGLPDGFDCIPCVERGSGGAWTISFPSELINVHGQKPTGENVASLYAARPPAEWWEFKKNHYRYREGKWHYAQVKTVELIKLLATSDGFVSYYQLVRWLYPKADPENKDIREMVHNRVSIHRRKLAKNLGLPDDFNPIPYCDVVAGGGWSVRVASEC